MRIDRIIRIITDNSFRYNKWNFSDNSLDHKFEVGGFSVRNLLPNENDYRDVLTPHEVNLRRQVDKSVFLRVFLKVKPPVAGIQMKEHFEVNVCPIAVRLTYKFSKNLERFFFPHKSTAESEPSEQPEVQLGVRGELTLMFLTQNTMSVSATRTFVFVRYTEDQNSTAVFNLLILGL